MSWIGPRPTPARIAQLRAMAERGMTVEATAEALRLSVRNVEWAAREHRITFKPQAFIDAFGLTEKIAAEAAQEGLERSAEKIRAAWAKLIGPMRERFRQEISAQ